MLIRMIHSGPGDPPLGDQEIDDALALELIEAGKALPLTAEDQVQQHNLGHQGARVSGDGWA